MVHMQSRRTCSCWAVVTTVTAALPRITTSCCSVRSQDGLVLSSSSPIPTKSALRRWLPLLLLLLQKVLKFL